MIEKVKNKGTGAGGSQTSDNGIRFENSSYLIDLMTQNGFLALKISAATKRSDLFEIYNAQRQLIAHYGRQGQMYIALKKMLGTSFSNAYIKSILSVKMKPDAFILNHQTKTLHIFEKKWQQGAGSVDEKIQTGLYKLEMFKKLLSQFFVDVTYEYILSDYFRAIKFSNIKDYYAALSREGINVIRVWTQNENLAQLRIFDYLSPR